MSLVLALGLVLGLTLTPARAALPSGEEAAASLGTLGLWKGEGTGQDDLTRPTDRTAGVVMLTRLLGYETDARDHAWYYGALSPFTDVAGWARGYIGCAWDRGLTQGVSATQFAGDRPMTAGHYLTLLLRALGYEEAAGDFTWDAAGEAAVALGVLTREELDGLGDGPLTRGTLAALSLRALGRNVKGEDLTLAGRLALRGALDWEQAAELGLVGGEKPETQEHEPRRSATRTAWARAYEEYLARTVPADSAMPALTLADLDRDGVPELLTADGACLSYGEGAARKAEWTLPAGWALLTGRRDGTELVFVRSGDGRSLWYVTAGAQGPQLQTALVWRSAVGEGGESIHALNGIPTTDADCRAAFALWEADWALTAMEVRSGNDLEDLMVNYHP